MAQQPAATPVIQEPMATPRSKEDFGTDTPREGSDANSPGENGQLRKRKYEEATEDEKLALNQYHIQNPQLKQRELAEWFKERFGKSINQSTVSRNLKKFKASPPSTKEPGPGRLMITPAKRERKGNASRTPPQKKIQITRLPPNGLSAVNLPPTPPPRENRTSPIDAALYEAYVNYRKLNHAATTEDCDRLLRAEARNLMANVRPGPSQEKLASPIIDDAWITNWKRVYGILPPPISASTIIPDEGLSGSEETEPRSPVSTVSSSDHRSHELSPNKGAVGLTQPTPSSSRPNGPVETPENKRNRQIEQLRKEIVKRDQRIEHEQRKKETALRKLEKLEKAANTGAAGQ